MEGTIWLNCYSLMASIVNRRRKQHQNRIFFFDDFRNHWNFLNWQLERLVPIRSMSRYRAIINSTFNNLLYVLVSKELKTGKITQTISIMSHDIFPLLLLFCVCFFRRCFVGSVSNVCTCWCSFVSDRQRFANRHSIQCSKQYELAAIYLTIKKITAAAKVKT